MRPFAEIPFRVSSGDVRAIECGPAPADARAIIVAAHGITTSSHPMTKS